MCTYPRAFCASIAVLVVGVGCSTPRVQDQLGRSPLPLAASTPTPRPPTDAGKGAASQQVTVHSSVTLPEALGLALRASPALAAAGWDVRGAEAAAWQASVRANPTLSVEAEEILGSGGLSGVDALAAAAVLDYEFQMGGKRGKRAEHARTQAVLTAWDYEAARLDVYTETRKAFVDAVAAQEAVALAHQSVALARAGRDAVSAQVAAGRSAALEETRAGIAVAKSARDLRTAQRAMGAARSLLIAQWGMTEAPGVRADGALDPLREPPDIEAARRRLADAPALARRPDELAALDAATRAARAEGAPDIGLGVGGQYFRETGEKSFVVEVGVPLPLFDTNRGSIAEAEASSAKGHEQARHAFASVQTAFDSAYAGLLSAYQEAVTIRDDILPQTQELLDKTTTGYTAGKFRYPDVLIAQEEFVKTQQAFLQARASYATALADVERLIARKLHAQEQPENRNRTQ